MLNRSLEMNIQFMIRPNTHKISTIVQCPVKSNYSTAAVHNF